MLSLCYLHFYILITLLYLINLSTLVNISKAIFKALLITFISNAFPFIYRLPYLAIVIYIMFHISIRFTALIAAHLLVAQTVICQPLHVILCTVYNLNVNCCWCGRLDSSKRAECGPRQTDQQTKQITQREDVQRKGGAGHSLDVHIFCMWFVDCCGISAVTSLLLVNILINGLAGRANRTPGKASTKNMRKLSRKQLEECRERWTSRITTTMH